MKHHEKGDFSVDCDSPYLLVDMNYFEEKTAMNVIQYSHVPVDLAGIPTHNNVTALANSTNQDVLSTSLGSLDDIGVGDNRYVVFAALNMLLTTIEILILYLTLSWSYSFYKNKVLANRRTTNCLIMLVKL